MGRGCDPGGNGPTPLFVTRYPSTLLNPKELPNTGSFYFKTARDAQMGRRNVNTSDR